MEKRIVQLLFSRYTLSKEELNILRNNKELALYTLCAIINLLIVYLVLIGFYFDVGLGLAYYIAFFYFFVSFVISLAGTFSASRLNAVRLGEDQFGEVYKIACSYAKTLGLKRVPRIYVKQNGGVINAFASYFFFKNYILINSDIFDVAYLKNKDKDALSFVIAHEMAHIAYSHTKIWYNFGILFSKYIPFLSSALFRAREYSCDNVAGFLCPEGKHGIFILLLGKHLYNNIDISAYLRQAKQTHGFFEFFGNLKSSHPVPVRRILALYGEDKERII